MELTFKKTHAAIFHSRPQLLFFIIIGLVASVVNSSSSTDLQGVWGLDINVDQTPASGSIHPWPPDLLIVAQLVSGEKWKDVSPLLVSVVVEGQAAGHGHRGHGWGQLGYFLEVLGVHRVHIHVVAWSSGRYRWVEGTQLWAHLLVLRVTIRHLLVDFYAESRIMIYSYPPPSVLGNETDVFSWQTTMSIDYVIAFKHIKQRWITTRSKQ